ncbi:hypothetical protein PVK06_017109 [Gossypium arboreum]|uniref:Uncharacterized protein n=1 Tax=Gossypium arboreum TaxID=29729 RepID=A0ABR0Q2M0_GOSAR|nr:hypothetical protein PVK06_017109 [Gossypium arboreum]
MQFSLDVFIPSTFISLHKSHAFPSYSFTRYKPPLHCADYVNEKNKEKDAEKESTENIFTEPKFVGATTNNLEQDGTRLVEAVEEATDDAGLEPKPEERSEDRAKSKEKKRKRSKEKKREKGKKNRSKKKHRATTFMAEEN